MRWLGETNCESERTFCTFSSMTFGLRAALPGECLEPAVTIRMNGLISRSEIVHQLRQIIMKFTINNFHVIIFIKFKIPYNIHSVLQSYKIMYILCQIGITSPYF